MEQLSLDYALVSLSQSHTTGMRPESPGELRGWRTQQIEGLPRDLWGLGFPVVGSGSFFGGPHDEDYSFGGSMLGGPCLGKPTVSAGM